MNAKMDGLELFGQMGGVTNEMLNNSTLTIKGHTSYGSTQIRPFGSSITSPIRAEAGV